MRKYLFITAFLLVIIRTMLLSQPKLIYLDKIIDTFIEVYYTPATIYNGDMYLFLCSDSTYIETDSRTYASVGVWNTLLDTLLLYPTLEGYSVDKMVKYNRDSLLFMFDPYPQKLILYRNKQAIIRKHGAITTIYINIGQSMLNNKKKVERKIKKMEQLFNGTKY